jgi:hypothetical protein
MNRTIERAKIESEEKWRDYVKSAPYINFPSKWDIQIIPPFAGAIMRFKVRYQDQEISVYADYHQSLGYFSNREGIEIPYWEIYPYFDDTYRCEISDTKTLIKKIKESLDNLLGKLK